MNPIDLFLLSKTKPLNIDEFNKYLECISNSKRKIKVRDYERNNLYELINLIASNCNIALLNGFYYSYSIDQIGKEFDLIKLCKDFVLNIEIKSEFTTKEKIKKQLILNVHYLKNIKSEVKAFTFVANSNSLYKLNSQLELEETNIIELKNILETTEEFINDNLDKLITPYHYLVSPFNNIDKFMNDEYFLTLQQEEIKNEILKDIYESMRYKFYKVLGDAGTGKTLLIYDIAKTLSKNKKICIVHSGILNPGHYELRKCMNNCDILSAKEFNNCKYSNYDIFIIDEVQRLYLRQFNDLVNHVKNNAHVIFSIGTDQIMQNSEERNDINGKIDQLKNTKQYKLSDKIRTNINLTSFIKNIVNLSNVNYDANYDNVDIFYVSTKNEANELLNYLNSQKYEYISFTVSLFNPHEIDAFTSSTNTHTVIGQEYDKVVMLMGQNFNYVKNRLYSREHPNPDYIFSKLFYQGITRAREKLAIVVHRNPDLYRILVKVKQNNKE